MLLQKKEFYIKDFSDFYKPIYKVDEDPASKLSDSSQSLTPPKFEEE
jgi:hypothetical protein